jgi:hypothetical protein
MCKEIGIGIDGRRAGRPRTPCEKKTGLMGESNDPRGDGGDGREFEHAQVPGQRSGRCLRPAIGTSRPCTRRFMAAAAALFGQAERCDNPCMVGRP